MLISDRKKFIYIHIPKTAGTSLMKLLSPYARPIDQAMYRWLVTRKAVSLAVRLFSLQDPEYLISGFRKHDSAATVRDRLGAPFNTYYSFSVVRNPFDWLVSEYYFIRGNKRHTLHAMARSLPFHAYIRWFLGMRPRRQSDYICDRNGKLLIDYVGKFEQLEDVITRLGEKLGISTRELPVLNRSQAREHRDYRISYDRTTRELVEAYFEEDLERFGYSFEAA